MLYSDSLVALGTRARANILQSDFCGKVNSIVFKWDRADQWNHDSASPALGTLFVISPLADDRRLAGSTEGE